MTSIENPYQSPHESSAVARAPLTNRQLAKKRLFQPGLVTLVAGVLMSGLGANALYQHLRLLRLLSERSADSQTSYDSSNDFFTLILIAVIASSLFCIYGGVQMLRLKRYRVCITTAILMTFPLTSPCNVLGLIVGIWTLIALLRKDTRAAFAEAK